MGMTNKECLDRIAKLTEELNVADITRTEALEALKDASFNEIANVTRGRSRKYRIDREDNDAHDIYMPRNYYTVYLNKTEEIIASGTAEECARQLNTTTDVFYCIKSRAMSGKIKKYSVVTERYECEEDDNDI